MRREIVRLKIIGRGGWMVCLGEKISESRKREVRYWKELFCVCFRLEGI